MTIPKLDENAIYDIQLESIQKDSYIDMRCTNYGYEEKMPEWCYAEEADFLIDDGDPEPPTWQCPKYYKETLVRKPDYYFNFFEILSFFIRFFYFILYPFVRELSYKKIKKNQRILFYIN